MTHGTGFAGYAGSRTTAFNELWEEVGPDGA